MSFSNGGYWYLLFLGIIPILIHLINFIKFKKVYFTQVETILTLTNQSKTPNKIKDLLILLCRFLAIIFLVLAFLNPIILDKNKKAIEDHVFFVDNTLTNFSEINKIIPIEQSKAYVYYQLK